ncbi:MAG: flotillin family protein [Sedimentisphaerales bacterium]
MLPIYITAVVIVVLVGLAFIKSNLRICPPNEILIFSGRKRKLKDGTQVGYRIIKGGRAFKIPIVESVSCMSLETMPIEIDLSGALSKGIIPINLKGIANIKIAGTEEEGMFNAVERFLDKSREEISRVARETLEGSLRGVLATLTPEEANTRRLQFAQDVTQEAANDLKRLGLVLDTFKIQDISDTQAYLEAIGRKKNAEVQRDAKIAEAESEAQARKVAAEAKKAGSIAEAEAEMITVEAENKLRVKKADLAAISNQAEAKAKVAGEIARVEEEKLLEEYRIELNDKRYQAEVVIPAQAEKEAHQLRAVGQAARIIEDGKATAEAVRLMRQEWQEGDTRELFLLQQLPDIIDKMTRVVSDNLSIEKLTIVDGGNGDGIPTFVRGVTGSIVAIMEQIKNATGLDIPEILQARAEAVRHNSRVGKEL